MTETETCPICRGEGGRVIETGIIFGRFIVCPKCNGMGRVEKEVAK